MTIAILNRFSSITKIAQSDPDTSVQKTLWLGPRDNRLESELEPHLLARPSSVPRIAEAHAAAGGWQHFNGCLLASRTSPYFVVGEVDEKSKFPRRR